MHCDYGAICYTYYANEIAECFEMTIERTCEHLTRASAQSVDSSDDPVDITMGKQLFDVYLALKRFAVQSAKFCSDSSSAPLQIHNYHEWFANGVTYWLDMHHITVFKRIKRAIEVDPLKPVDELAKYSTSAIDTIAIFHSIKEFWFQLNWPDSENAFTFAAKIVDDICQCCAYYAEKMGGRVCESSDDDFYATPALCLILNDIDYVRENLSKFIMELDIDGILGKLMAYRSHADAKRCHETLENMLENAMDTIDNQIVEFSECVAFKMCTHLHKCIWDAAECLHTDALLIDQLMANLEKSMATLSAHLNETNFQRILTAVWEKFKIFFATLLQNCLDVRQISISLRIYLNFQSRHASFSFCLIRSFRLNVLRNFIQT